MAQARILIIEDEKTASKALERKFTNSGFETHVAGNGEEALERLKNESFDVILLDLVLPKMDGYDVLKALQENNNQVPVIVLTNLGADADMEKTRELGAREHFVKSMTPMKQVVETIQDLLGLPKAADA